MTESIPLRNIMIVQTLYVSRSAPHLQIPLPPSEGQLVPMRRSRLQTLPMKAENYY